MLKKLYKIYQDDLKDAGMIASYAEDMRAENKAMADNLMVNAKNRLAHAGQVYQDFWGLLQERLSQKDMSVTECLMDIIKMSYEDWAEEVEERIKHWK